MRIGLVRRGYSATGGAERYLRRLADALAGAGHQPALVATPQWPRDQWPTERPFFAVSDAGGSPRAFAEAVAALEKRGGFDRLFSLERVFRCDCYRAGDGVHRAWLERRAQAEPWWRGFLRRANGKHRQTLALETSLFAEGGARKIIANSRLVRDEIIRCYGTPPERITVVYNGLPAGYLQGFDPVQRARERSALGLQEEDYAILFAGTGWERKGLAHALAAVGRLPEALRARLLVAGRGNPRPYLRRIPADKRARASFLGPVRDMRALYAAADVFVAPTLYDPFSNACLEAMAAGLPVLTTRANGFSEIITPGREGDVFDVEDRPTGEALAALLTAWADPARRTTARPVCAGTAARLTIESNVAQTLAVLLD